MSLSSGRSPGAIERDRRPKINALRGATKGNRMALTFQAETVKASGLELRQIQLDNS
jgi:hypothetical protein